MIHQKRPDSAPVLHKLLHILERVIAIITLVVLIGMLLITLYNLGVNTGILISTGDTTTISLEGYLHNVLTIVVGLEFVRMLINLTPANTLEVLIVAIARQVILNHGDGLLNNVVSVICIAALFAIKRFLIPKNDLKIELSDADGVCECESEDNK